MTSRASYTSSSGARSSGRKPDAGYAPRPVGQLLDRNPSLCEPLIEGLLRRGETMNIIAASKAGKSWMVLDLALAVATGRPWLNRFRTHRGGVLLIDNELHPETSAHRIPRVARARAIDTGELVHSDLHVANLRGSLQSIRGLHPKLMKIEPGRFRLIVLDAWYRFLPADTNENDNGAIAGLYNLLDLHARRLNCSFVLIHHTNKGNQSGKDVTDVGAGAGAQSRAADTHLVLRRHQEEGCVVLDAVVRSWPPLDPVGLRWQFPAWYLDATLDPEALYREPRGSRAATGANGGSRGAATTTAAAASTSKNSDPAEGSGGDSGRRVRGELRMTPAEFAERFLSFDEPRIRDVIFHDASVTMRISRESAQMLLAKAMQQGLVEGVQPGGRGTKTYYVRVRKDDSDLGAGEQANDGSEQ